MFAGSRLIGFGAYFSGVPTELIASSLTALALLGVRKVYKFGKDARIRKKFPLAGEYISYYGDIVNGQKVSRKASLIVKQSGKSFTAENSNLDDERNWDLRGQILEHGYLAGTYGRLDPSDPSKGTFFMEPDIECPGVYRGHWSGQDSTNRQLSTDTYVWRKILQCEIRTLDIKDSAYFDQILAIFAEALGDRFITRESLKKILIETNQKYLQAAFDGDQVVGVRTVCVLDEEDKLDFETKVRVAGGRISLKNLRVGMLASNAVKSSHRRKGVGSQLVRSGMELLNAQKCTACVAISWESKSKDSSASVLESFGFELLAKAENHWKSESLEKDYACPKCGEPPCSCSAFFYLKRM